MDNTNALGKGQAALAVAVLLMIFGLVGRWDYEDALLTERAMAKRSARGPTCKDEIGKTTREHNQSGQRATSAVDHHATEQATSSYHVASSSEIEGSPTCMAE